MAQSEPTVNTYGLGDAFKRVVRPVQGQYLGPFLMAPHTRVGKGVTASIMKWFDDGVTQGPGPVMLERLHKASPYTMTTPTKPLIIDDIERIIRDEMYPERDYRARYYDYVQKIIQLEDNLQKTQKGTPEYHSLYRELQDAQGMVQSITSGDSRLATLYAGMPRLNRSTLGSAGGAASDQTSAHAHAEDKARQEAAVNDAAAREFGVENQVDRDNLAHNAEESAYGTGGSGAATAGGEVPPVTPTRPPGVAGPSSNIPSPAAAPVTPAQRTGMPQAIQYGSTPGIGSAAAGRPAALAPGSPFRPPTAARPQDEEEDTEGAVEDAPDVDNEDVQTEDAEDHLAATGRGLANPPAAAGQPGIARRLWAAGLRGVANWVQQTAANAIPVGTVRGTAAEAGELDREQDEGQAMEAAAGGRQQPFTRGRGVSESSPLRFVEDTGNASGLAPGVAARGAIRALTQQAARGDEGDQAAEPVWDGNPLTAPSAAIETVINRENAVAQTKTTPGPVMGNTTIHTGYGMGFDVTRAEIAGTPLPPMPRRYVAGATQMAESTIVGQLGTGGASVRQTRMAGGLTPPPRRSFGGASAVSSSAGGRTPWTDIDDDSPPRVRFVHTAPVAAPAEADPAFHAAHVAHEMQQAMPVLESVEAAGQHFAPRVHPTAPAHPHHTWWDPTQGVLWTFADPAHPGGVPMYRPNDIPGYAWEAVPIDPAHGTDRGTHYYEWRYTHPGRMPRGVGAIEAVRQQRKRVDEDLRKMAHAQQAGPASKRFAAERRRLG